MNDETEKSAGTVTTPNRGSRREPPTIEGHALESETSTSATAETAAPDLTADPTAPPRARLDWPGPAALAALLLCGVALFSVFDPALPPVASRESVLALGQRLDALEARLAAQEAKPAPVLPAPADLAPLSRRLDAVETATADARTQAERALEQSRIQPTPPAAPRVDLGPLDQRLSRLEARLDSELAPLRSALATPKTDMRATQSPDITGMAGRDSAALAAVAGSLHRQIDRGTPFPREASALGRLGADPARLAKLAALAETGVPSAARLAQDFSALSATLLRAGAPVRAEGDLMDRLARSAASLVRIRSVGEIAGEDAPARVSRIEGSLHRGEVAEALAAFDRLPDDLKAPARDWATRARQRVEAEAAVRSLLDDALDTLARK